MRVDERDKMTSRLQKKKKNSDSFDNLLIMGVIFKKNVCPSTIFSFLKINADCTDSAGVYRS